MYQKKIGWYYLNNTMPVPVGQKTMYYRQKIHSSHHDFDKIDIKYFLNALVCEDLIPMGERGLYTEFSGEIPSYTKVEEEYFIKETVQTPTKLPEGNIEVIETKNKIESEVDEAPTSEVKPKRTRKKKEKLNSPINWTIG